MIKSVVTLLLPTEINLRFVVKGEDVTGAEFLPSDPLLPKSHGEKRDSFLINSLVPNSGIKV